MPTVKLPFITHRNMRDLRSCELCLSCSRVFSSIDASLWPGAPRHQSKDSFVCGFPERDPPETNRILGDPVAFPPGLPFRVLRKTLSERKDHHETLDHITPREITRKWPREPRCRRTAPRARLYRPQTRRETFHARRSRHMAPDRDRPGRS